MAKTLIHEPIVYKGRKIDFGLENPEEANIPMEELSEHLGKPSTERTKRLKANCRWKHASAGEFVDEGVRAGIERMRYVTEGHIKSVGKLQVLRRAEMLSTLLRKMSVLIMDDELIVGYHAENPKYIPLCPELSYGQIADYLASKYAPQPVEEAKEIAEYWKPYSLQSVCEPFFTEDELKTLYNASLSEGAGFANGFNSIVPPYETVLEDGLLKRIQMAEANIARGKAEMGIEPWNAEQLPWCNKIAEWEAMIQVDKAVIVWARRHARLARIVAENFETNPKRKEELLLIAEICQNVPANPARSLREAMQAKWFTYLLCHALERYASGYAQLEDKLLWPFYRASVVDKTVHPMTHAEAVELFECERLKVANHGAGKSRLFRTIFPGSNDLFILTIGGLNRFGQDNCTDCTDAILEAARNVRTTEPSIVFRWHPMCRLKTKRLVFECIRDGLGYPSIKHHALNTAQLLWLGQFSKNNNGATPMEANEWANVLCMSPGLVGRRKTQKTRSEGGAAICTDKFIELALFDGFDWSFAGVQAGPHTGDPRDFKTFKEMWDAFRKQIQHIMSLNIRSKDVSRIYEGERVQCPFVSSIDDGCMEYGIDAMVLSEQPNPWHNPMSNIVALNSLIAIKKLVYDDQKYTMDELIEALKANWEGYEQMQKDFWNAPKWGNDDPYADALAKAFFEDIVSREWRSIINYSGAPVSPGGQSVGFYLVMGTTMGPTPDGRFGGDPASDGGISPYMGTDRKGPTAVLKSASKINPFTQKFELLNQRLSPSVMRSKHGFSIWLEYMNTWYDLNIDHVQFNVVSSEEMHAAQKEPERHTDLIVRIAGYSARFVDISKYAQDTIIARTEQDFGPQELELLDVDL
jgi:benzylsuccinate synthase